MSQVGYFLIVYKTRVSCTFHEKKTRVSYPSFSLFFGMVGKRVSRGDIEGGVEVMSLQ